jgi:hypothetical protein
MIIAYIAHPVGAINAATHQEAFGQVYQNLLKIRRIVRQINLTEPDVVPFVPYYADLVSMSDWIPAERERGIKNDIAILKSGCVNEVRLYGNRISDGMLAEINLADALGIPVKPMTEGTSAAKLNEP